MSESESGGGGNLELDRVRRLVQLMCEFDLQELELKNGDQQIRIARGALPAFNTHSPPVAPPMPAGVSMAPPSAALGAPPDGANIAIIKSPMVGTFYSRPNPKAQSFVKVGDYVQPEKTVCIIEAMKVFNEIPAEVQGRVIAVLVEEEEPVEFGKPLFKVDTAG